MDHNIAYTYNPKGKNPYTGEGDNKYLVPAVKNQKGKKYNFVVVACSPSFNGVYKYPVAKQYDTGINHTTPCYYIPIDDCEFCSFDDLPSGEVKDDILKHVKSMQNTGYKNEVKNRDYDYKNGKPDWML